MKKILISLAGLIIYGMSFAQLPKWMITPNYDRITVKVDDSLLQTDSLGTSTLWTMDGKRLFTTKHFINPFKDGVATITKKGTKEYVGIVDTTGRFTALPNVQVAYDHPVFENGYLICRDVNGFSYYKKDGSKAKLRYTLKPYPFHAGYAPYQTYANLESQKDSYYGYHREDGQEMQYVIKERGKEKVIDHKDIQFLSAIGENNRGVAVIKDKVYLFNPETQLFEPFLYGDGDSEKKRHLAMSGDYNKYFESLPSDTVEILARYGKKQYAVLKFDKELHPVSFLFDGEELKFKKKESPKFEYPTELKSFSDGDMYGLASTSQKLLPPQFEAVTLMYGYRAFVKHNGKWGVIEIIPDISYDLKLNKNEDIAFRHQKFETQIRLDFPPIISSKEARINIPASSGCSIDKTSRETKDTESGNFVVYDCTLEIPDSLPDKTSAITYSPISITYDGLQLYDTSKTINAWHFKYFNVDPIDTETSISNGVVSFTININALKNAGESDYPFDVRIEADTISAQYEKISETRYKCIVSNLKEGKNILNILVTEKGCPPSVFPFEVFYTKPLPKKKKKETVVVRKAPQMEL